MELRQLATFVAVAEESSFTRAAERLHVVQSAVSASVRNLEKELGTRLFDRSTHTVKLTDAGNALMPEARATLAAAQAARDAVDEARGGLRGTIVLGTMQAQGMHAIDLAAVLSSFRAEHPGVERSADVGCEPLFPLRLHHRLDAGGLERLRADNRFDQELLRSRAGVEFFVDLCA